MVWKNDRESRESDIHTHAEVHGPAQLLPQMLSRAALPLDIDIPTMTSLQKDSSQADFERVLGELAARKDASALQSWFDAALSSGLSIVAVRPLLDAFAAALKSLDAAAIIVAGRHAVDTLQPRVASYEEQDSVLRDILADAYTTDGDFSEAAKVLQGIQLESSQRKVSDADKFKLWVRICRLYLEDGDTTTAETFLNRAKNLMWLVDDPVELLNFKLSQARISDSQRRFLEAGTVYHEISAVPAIAESERDQTMGRAIVCAVLAPAGVQRNMLLRSLHRDERAQGLEEFTMLENMYLGRLVAPEQVEAFAAKLEDHQLAQTADGSTVLAKAVIEHNLLGISGLYDSIEVSELGALVGLAPAKAEEFAARMVEQHRLAASIDHVQGYIYFRGEGGSGESARFDERVRLLLEDIERVAGVVAVKG